MDTEFIQSIPAWGLYALIAGLACAESLAVIGVLVPGVALLTLAAAVAGEQQLSLLLVLLAGLTGAVVGDALSFALGYIFKDKIATWPGFKSHPQWISKSTDFFIGYGAASVVLGRFVGPIRPFVPVAAGLFRMPPKTFFVLNVASASLWAPLYLLPGYYTGEFLDLSNPWIWAVLAAATLIAFGVSYWIGKRSQHSSN